jgi:aspartyl-tRNA(Asn)/glutamyl-tRNA(Gln) amidotransferase subunit A
MARNVMDISLLMEVISRYDPRDSTSRNAPYTHTPSASIRGVRIGVPSEFFGEGVDTGVAAIVRRAIEDFAALGATIIPCSMPSMRYALAAYYVTCTSEASSNLARFDGVRHGPHVDYLKPWHDAYRDERQRFFGQEVRRRILLGTFALSAGYYGKYYAKAQVARENVRQDFHRLFESVDLIAGPTMPSVAWKLGEKSDPLAMYLSDILTVPANLAGVPAISIPCGEVDGLPVGLQLIGRPFEDERVIDAAYAYEQGAAR